jgi:hypothetical protein
MRCIIYSYYIFRFLLFSRWVGAERLNFVKKSPRNLKVRVKEKERGV